MIMVSPIRLIGSLQCQLTETPVHGQTCRYTRTHYPDSEPTNLCFYSFKLCAQQRSSFEPMIYLFRREHAPRHTTDVVGFILRCQLLNHINQHDHVLLTLSKKILLYCEILNRKRPTYTKNGKGDKCLRPFSFVQLGKDFSIVHVQLTFLPIFIVLILRAYNIHVARV